MGRTPPSVATPTVASLPFKRHALKQLHVNAAKEKGCECKDNNKEGEEKEEENRERNVRTLPGKSAEKVSVQDQCGYHHEEKYQGRIHHHGVMYGQQRQQQHVHRHKEPHTFDLPVATNGKASALAGSEHPFGSTAPSGSPSHLVRTFSL